MKQRTWVLFAFFLSGFAALIYEVAYTKGLILIIGTSVYAYSLTLATFLWGMGLGSLIARRWLRSMNSAHLLVYLQWGIGLFGIVFIPLINRLNIPYLIIYELSRPSFILFSALLIILSFFVLLVPAMLMGMTFPVVSCTIARRECIGNDVGTIFAVNTLGGVFGSFSAGFLFIPILGLEPTILLGASVSLLASLLFYIPFRKTLRAPAFVVPVVILVLLLFASSSVKLDPYNLGIYYTARDYGGLAKYRKNHRQRRENTKILFSDYGLYGNVTVMEKGENKFLLINGKTDAGTTLDITTQFLIGYIPLILHKNPIAVAVIGLGSGMTVDAATHFDVEQVDVFEINPSVIEASRFFDDGTRHVLDEPRVNIVEADARNYLSTAKKEYDVIISEPSNPWIEGEGYLFTKEFYEIIRSRLAHDGIFSQWVGAYDFEPEDFKILLRTVQLVFPNLQLWVDELGADFYLIASKEELNFDYAHVQSAFREKSTREDFDKIGQISMRQTLPYPDLFFSFYLADSRSLEEYTGRGLINTDNRSVIEFRTARNRVFGGINNLLPLLEFLGNGEKITRLPLPMENLVRVSEGRIEFVDLQFDAGGMVPEDQLYEFQYKFPDHKQKKITIQIEPHVVSTYSDGEKILTIHACPQGVVPSSEEYERVASILDSTVESWEEIAMGPRYHITGEGLLGMIQYCTVSKHLYIIYFEYENADEAEIRQLLENMQCRDLTIHDHRQ